MITLTLQQIAEITGGYLDCVADPQAVVTASVEFDSRKVEPGGLFLCIPGARVDGHDFAATAVAQGAVAVIAARPVGVPAIVVEPTGAVQGSAANADIYAHDTDGAAAAIVGALSDLAAHVTRTLQRESGLCIVGITGSAGKTSTKDLMATVLAHEGSTVAPPGSFNNEVGHPYTALRCTEQTKFLVAEMSARGIGHIAHLAEIAAPTVGVVLNVGSAHLGEFGSRDNIAKAKGELVEALPSAAEGGVAVLNADDDAVAAMAARTSAKVVTYSARGLEADYSAHDISADVLGRPTFTLHSPAGEYSVSLQVFGAHQVSNALAVIAAAAELGLDMHDIVSALGNHTSVSAHRMDVRERADGVVVIDDAYNANPDSMAAAIAALAHAARAGAGEQGAHPLSIAVLGPMGELGEDAVEEHRGVAAQLQNNRIDHLVAVGDDPNSAALAAEAQSRGINTTVVPDVTAATAAVNGLLSAAHDGAIVLVKASNAQALWRVAEELNKV